MLRESKAERNIQNKQIAFLLNIPQTKVDHWFRKDKHFCIPDDDLWMDLKAILGIKTTEFDKAIMTFEERIGNFDMAEKNLSFNRNCTMYLVSNLQCKGVSKK